MIDPRIFPIPPSTTKTRIVMDILYPKLFVFAVSVDRLCAYRTPAAPAIAAEIVNAISLYFVTLIPIDSAAITVITDRHDRTSVSGIDQVEYDK